MANDDGTPGTPDRVQDVFAVEGDGWFETPTGPAVSVPSEPHGLLYEFEEFLDATQQVIAEIQAAQEHILTYEVLLEARRQFGKDPIVLNPALLAAISTVENKTQDLKTVVEMVNANDGEVRKLLMNSGDLIEGSDFRKFAKSMKDFHERDSAYIAEVVDKVGRVDLFPDGRFSNFMSKLKPNDDIGLDTLTRKLESVVEAIRNQGTKLNGALKDDLERTTGGTPVVDNRFLDDFFAQPPSQENLVDLAKLQSDDQGWLAGVLNGVSEAMGPEDLAVQTESSQLPGAPVADVTPQQPAEDAFGILFNTEAGGTSPWAGSPGPVDVEWVSFPAEVGGEAPRPPQASGQVTQPPPSQEWFELDPVGAPLPSGPPTQSAPPVRLFDQDALGTVDSTAPAQTPATVTPAPSGWAQWAKQVDSEQAETPITREDTGEFFSMEGDSEFGLPSSGVEQADKAEASVNVPVARQAKHTSRHPAGALPTRVIGPPKQIEPPDATVQAANEALGRQ